MQAQGDAVRGQLKSHHEDDISLRVNVDAVEDERDRMPELNVSVIRSPFPVMRRGVAEEPFEEGREEVLGVGAHEVPPEGLQGGRSEGRQKDT